MGPTDPRREYRAAMTARAGGSGRAGAAVMKPRPRAALATARPLRPEPGPPAPPPHTALLGLGAAIFRRRAIYRRRGTWHPAGAGAAGGRVLRGRAAAPSAPCR